MSADPRAAGVTARRFPDIIDRGTFGRHIALGVMIYDAQDDRCSHCYGRSDTVGEARVRLHRDDPFWFQYCSDCAQELDMGLVRLIERVRRNVRRRA